MNQRQPPGVTRGDVARESGTSVAVVSYVVNNGPRPVAAKTRQRVLDAIARTGYRPNGIARALAGGSTMTLGLIVPDISNEFFAELAFAVEQSARTTGHTVLLGNSEGDADAELKLIETFLDRQIDGVIVASETPDATAQRAEEAGTRVVFLGPAPSSTTSVSISVDDEGGALRATRHLIEHGYRSVSMIAGPDHDAIASARRAGWETALGESGVDGRAVGNAFTVEGGFLAGIDLLSDPTPPRAIFASSDRQAIGLLRAAADRSLNVPDDLAIVTFDGSSASAYAVPSLSTIAQPITQMAELATATLLDPAIRTGATTLDVSLIVRRSCGCSTSAHN